MLLKSYVSLLLICVTTLFYFMNVYLPLTFYNINEVVEEPVRERNVMVWNLMEPFINVHLSKKYFWLNISTITFQ